MAKLQKERERDEREKQQGRKSVKKPATLQFDVLN
jgi:hypothetical protein